MIDLRSASRLPVSGFGTGWCQGKWCLAVCARLIHEHGGDVAVDAGDEQVAAFLAQVRGGTAGGPRILVKSPDRILFLKPPEIEHIEAAGNYLILHAGKERHMIRDTMAAMEARLAGAGFMRVSRSALVNLSRIRELQPDDSVTAITELLHVAYAPLAAMGVNITRAPIGSRFSWWIFSSTNRRLPAVQHCPPWK